MIRKFSNTFRSMSKNKKSSQKNLKLSVPTTATTSPQNSFISITKDGHISMKILAKPGAKQNSITDITSEGIGIQISAPPIEGEANTELIKYLSKILGLRKSDISLDKGSKSRNKIVLISKGTITEDKLIELLKKESLD